MFKNNPYIFLIKKVWYHSRYTRHLLVCGLFLTIFSQAIYTLTPYLIGRVFDVIQVGGDNVFYNVRFWLVLVVSCKVVFWALWWPGRIFERNNLLGVNESFWEEYYQKLLNLPYIWHQDNHSGNTISRITKSHAALDDFAQNHYRYVTHFGKFFAPLVFLFFVSLKLFSILVLYTVLIILVTKKFDEIIAHCTKKANVEKYHFSGVIFDYIGNIMTVLSLRLGKKTKAHALVALRRFFPHYKKYAVVSETKWLVISCSSIVVQSFMLGYFVWEQLYAGNGVVAIGITVSVYNYLIMFNDVLGGFVKDYQKLVQWQADYEGVDLIDQATKKSEQGNVKKLKISWQSVTLSDADFSYNRKGQKLTIDELVLHRGRKIALVGASGDGKTTLMALIRGILDFNKGEAFVDSKQTDLASVQAVTSLIPQDPEIFENTIHYNVTFGLSGNKKAVDKMVKMACFDSVIKQLPNGLKTNIKERGVNLSGGQKQRLALARSLYAAQKSDIVLMDESTSSVDSETEYKIYKNIFREWPDKTIVASIHRLNLLPLFDEVIVMKKGKMAQMNDVKTALKEKGPMKKLWDQFQEQQKHEKAV